MKKVLLFIIVLFALAAPVSAQAATLSFDPPTGALSKGCEVTIRINLDTQGIQTDGTDAILTYVPSQLTITPADITNGTIYPEYPGNIIDSASGKISISGISSVSSPFTGTGTFATLKFRVADTAAVGTPINLKFDFDPNAKTKTTDSNVVERGTIADVLNSVTDGSYTVGTGPCTNGGVTTAANNGAFGGQGQLGQDGLPINGAGSTSSAQFPVVRPNLNDMTGGSAGILDNTFAVAGVGILLVILGVAGLAML